MLIAEDLLLLLTDDRSGRLTVTAAQVDIALGGASLVELTLAGKVDLTGEGDQGRPGRIVVRDAAPPGDPVLDTALQTLVALSGKKPPAVIRPLSKNLRRTLYERLVGGGILKAERGKVLGIFPTRSWPTESTLHSASTRSSTHASTACPGMSCGPGRARSRRAAGGRRRSARRSSR